MSDFFADIATTRYTAREGSLKIPDPTPVPNRHLPWAEQHTTRPVAEKIETPEQMRAALAELRKNYAPFLKELAPPLPQTRDVMELTEFDWRIETEEDRQNFQDSLNGEGTWERVLIPHYGPPLGKTATLYRCTFDLPEQAAERPTLHWHFGGIDYRCQIYLNARCIGTHEGFFDEFKLDATQAIRSGLNVLLIRVENDFTMLGENLNNHIIDGDKIYAATGLGYDEPTLGWHHCPAGMGIWNFVRLVGTAEIYIDDLWVRPLPDQQAAEVLIEINNQSKDYEADITPVLSIFGQNFNATVLKNYHHKGSAEFVRGHGDLDHGHNKESPTRLGCGLNVVSIQIPIEDAKIWTPETPWLYQVQVTLLNNQNNQVLDAAKVQFGMRTFAQDETSTPKGKFYLNGQEIRLRGANTMGHLERCVMQNNPEALQDQILLAKLTNMNFLRMTQRPVHHEIYDCCDRLGMMTQTDLPLFSTIRRNQFSETARQAGCMERHVRRHASSILVSFINEPRPVAASKPHRFLYRNEMESLFQICANTVRFHNPDRIIKFVDGDYDPPATQGMPDNHVYCGWYIGHGVDLGGIHQGKWLPIKPDWHFGCGEFGAEGLDSYALMQKYPQHWQPETPDAPWTPAVIAMAQTWNFHFLWYDAGRTAREWIEASQTFQCWSVDLMTRAYRRMADMNTFAVHLFIDAWPAGWMKAIIDSSCAPKKAWFAYRDALTPLSVSLRSDRTQVFSGETLSIEAWVCNDHPEAFTNHTLAYDLTQNNTVLASGTFPADIPACTPHCQGLIDLAVPDLQERGEITVGLSLIDGDGKAIHSHELTLTVFPTPDPLSENIHCPQNTPELTSFLHSLGIEKPSEAGDIILCAGLTPDSELFPQLATRVKEGATVVLLDLPPGDYHLGANRITITTAGMGPRHFVSRASGHPMVEEFEANDFRFWHNQTLGRPAPLLTTTIQADGWNSILLTGDGGWASPWDYRPAAAEKTEGKGCWRICQVHLLETINTNPAANYFTRKLLTADR